MPRKQATLAIIDDGPTIFELPEKDPTLAITASEAGQTISFTFDTAAPWALETGAYMIKYQGQPQNPQRNFFDSPWRLIDTIAGVDSTGASSPDEENCVYAIAEGQRQWVYVRVSRLDGRLSEPFRADCFVGA